MSELSAFGSGSLARKRSAIRQNCSHLEAGWKDGLISTSLTGASPQGRPHNRAPGFPQSKLSMGKQGRAPRMEATPTARLLLEGTASTPATSGLSDSGHMSSRIVGRGYMTCECLQVGPSGAFHRLTSAWIKSAIKKDEPLLHMTKWMHHKCIALNENRIKRL